jgi:adenylate cyclase
MTRQLAAGFFILTFTATAVPAVAAEPLTIAVVPFANLSGDPEQDYLSDVVTDNTVKILSKASGLFVVSGGSPVTGQDKALPEIAKDLGVRYVLQGGVEESGDRVHMTATLSDTADDKTPWSEDYERELTAIFDIQDEITREVVSAVGVQPSPDEQQHIWRRQTNDLEAYQAMLEGREHYLRFTPDDMVEAQKLYGKALERDPDFATAWAFLGQAHVLQATYQWVEDTRGTWARAREAADKALAADETNPYAFALLGYIEQAQGEPADAVALAEKAAALAPSDATLTANHGAVLTLFGAQPKEGLELVLKAMRLSSPHPDWFHEASGWANYSLGDYDKALSAFQEYHKRNPGDTDGYVEIIYTSATLGRLEEARTTVAELLGKYPDFTIEGYSMISKFKDPEVAKLIRDNTAKAGLPQ